LQFLKLFRSTHPIAFASVRSVVEKAERGAGMKFRLAMTGMLLLGLFSPVSKGQEEPTLEAFVGYSNVRVRPADPGLGYFSLHGGDVQAALRLSKWFSAVADIGVYAAGHQPSQTVGIDLHGTAVSYLFGPRVSYRRGSRFTPFAQALFGVGHSGAGLFATSGAQNAFAFSAGGGIDFRVQEHWAIRPIAIDYLRTRFSEQNGGTLAQNNTRYSTGIVFRF
jgi:opacity protein-like surface antigen